MLLPGLVVVLVQARRIASASSTRSSGRATGSTSTLAPGTAAPPTEGWQMLRALADALGMRLWRVCQVPGPGRQVGSGSQTTGGSGC